MASLEQILKDTPDYAPDALPVASAERIIAALVQPLTQTERVPLRDALGRVLGEDVRSRIDVPEEPCSAMDGWAVRASDLSDREVDLAEVGASFAGRPYAGEVGPGQAVRIMTGALLPRGTDTVVIQEAVRAEGGRIRVPAGQRPGENVRPAGEDMKQGQVALCAGMLVRPATIGLAASLGVGELKVMRRVRVAFFSTGDELTPLGEPLARGQLYDSNRHALWAMLARLGCEALDLGVVRDDPTALEAAMERGAREADAIVTTGGASEGEADFTKKVAAKLGEVAFWKLALRPGRPFAFGRIGRALFFGMPGNPVASVVTFYRLVQPALLRLAGCRQPGPLLIPAKAACAMKKRVGREEYQRGIVERGADGELRVKLTGGQGSAMMSSMCEANCLVVLPRESKDVRPGDTVSVLLIESLS